MKDNPTRKKLLTIIEKYLSGKASPQEKEFLEAYYEFFEPEADYLQTQDAAGVESLGADIKAGINQAIQHKKAKTVRLWPSIAAAASVLILISAGLLLFKHPAEDKRAEQIMPMQKGITLTLANGKKIALDKTAKGAIRLADGSLVNNSGSSLDYTGEDNNDVDMQTLTNNTGSAFKLKLADGTEVYLDANSSITYPPVFRGSERQVSMTGQAYFKVVHNPEMPFAVKAGSETVNDIGTEFDINSYDGLKATLVEGAISLRNRTLKPGTQAVIEKGAMEIHLANIDAETAWIYNKIVFDHETLQDILNEVSRVYGIKVYWQDNDLKQLKFGGTLSRANKLAAILDFFRKTGEVDFKVDEHTINVLSPK